MFFLLCFLYTDGCYGRRRCLSFSLFFGLSLIIVFPYLDFPRFQRRETLLSSSFIVPSSSLGINMDPASAEAGPHFCHEGNEDEQSHCFHVAIRLEEES